MAIGKASPFRIRLDTNCFASKMEKIPFHYSHDRKIYEGMKQEVKKRNMKIDDQIQEGS